MEAIYIILIWCIIISIVGTLLRMGIQYRRDGEFPWGDKPWELNFVIELFIGAVAGVVVWLVALASGQVLESALQSLLYLTALAFGYAGADAVEGILKKYEPDPDV